MIFCVSPEPYLDLHGYTAQSVETLLATLASLGIGGIDFDYPPPVEEPAWLEKAQLVLSAARRRGMGISVHGPFLDISAADPQARMGSVAAHQRALAQIAQLGRGFTYVLHPEAGNNQRQPGDDQLREAMCHQSLAELVPLARQSGARLALENMRYRADNPNRTGMYTDRLAEILRGLEENIVGICFDVGHGYLSEGDGLCDAFCRHASRIIHVHLADNQGVEDDHLEPGQGRIDWRRFYEGVRSSQYGGMLQLEVNPADGEDPLAFYRRNQQFFARLAGLRSAEGS